MQPGQKIGPFVVEKELGSGAMGAVYRAVYTKTGQRVAIKLVALGLATNSTALARFEREGNILKQLKHPNIVRLFGTGRHGDTPYYAMEYIEGEPLDKVLARRERHSWEDVVALGEQLCAALQHAHEKGIIHRDLKPANLMILPDGTLKLTDFGIAKDIDVTGLTGANSTVGTASYMSPEQCKGDPDISPKSDLYSLGIVFYELLTGRKPFLAETPMEMFMKHLNEEPVRPSLLVPDIPQWLDTLVMHLLEKKPDRRPFNAETVGKALEQVAEKVQARHSAGLDAVMGRSVDRPRTAQKPDEEDKETARSLKGGAAGKKGRKRRAKPFYTKVWFQAVGIAGLLLALIGVIWWVMQPPPAETLYFRAKKLMDSKNPDDWYTAREGPLEEYLKHYGNRDDEYTRNVRDAVLRVDAYDCDKLLLKFVRSRKGAMLLKAEPDSEMPWQRQALEAALAEDTGDLAKAREVWQELKRKYEAEANAKGWAYLAGMKLSDLDAVEKQARQLADKVERWRMLKLEFRADNDIEKAAETALKAEIAGDNARARDAWQDLKKQNEDDLAQHRLVVLAAKRARELTKTETSPKS